MWRLLCHFFDIFSFTVKITPDTFRSKSSTLQLLKIHFSRTYRWKRNKFTLGLDITYAGGWSLWGPFSFILIYSDLFMKFWPRIISKGGVKMKLRIITKIYNRVRNTVFYITASGHHRDHPSSWELIKTFPYSHFW